MYEMHVHREGLPSRAERGPAPPYQGGQLLFFCAVPKEEIENTAAAFSRGQLFLCGGNGGRAGEFFLSQKGFS